MRKLRLITINLHCLEEPNLKENQAILAHTIIQKDIDVIFLQEVAQYIESPCIKEPVKKSNYAYQLKRLLSEKGYYYSLYYDTIKQSFGKYDEGVAILSRFELGDVQSNYISKCHEPHYWRTRKMIKGDLVRLDKTISFVSVHLGWTDQYERFEDQLERVLSHLDENHVLLIGGDFNVSPSTNEYSAILKKGLHDLFGSIPKYLFEPTHIKDIDLHKGSTRIDYIFANMNLEVLHREILFKKKKISDHYGVYIEIRL